MVFLLSFLESWCLLRLDSDLARLGRFVLGQLQLQDPIFEMGINLFGIHREGKRQDTYERPEAPFLTVANSLLQHRRFTLALESDLRASPAMALQLLA